MVGFLHLPQAKIKSEKAALKNEEEAYYEQQKIDQERDGAILLENLKDGWEHTSSSFRDWFDKTFSSSDPNKTSSKKAFTTYNTSYPITTNLSDYCILTFYDYDRFVSRQKKEEKVTLNIQLPLPLNVPDAIQTNNNTVDLGIYGNITTDNFNSLIKSNSGDNIEEGLNTGIGQLTENITQSSAKSAMKVGVALATSKFSDGGIKAASQLHTGLVLNPHTTAMFDGVALRSYNLDWRFSPKTKEESDRLNEIITCIKLRSLPGELAGGLSLNYPDTVQVSFEGRVKKYFPGYQRSFLTSITVTPDSNGGIMLYNSGAPVTYNIQLGFIELNINTRSTVKSHMEEQMQIKLDALG